jgi:peptide/nickel transport system permease protein
MDEEFVRAARARGASPRDVLWRHVIPRTAGAMATVLGLLAPLLVGGAALVETVFAWPGAGSTLVDAVTGRDYPVVIAFVLIGSIAVSFGSAVADVGARAFNPALRDDA